MSLKSQKRMAAKLLKVGRNRVWIDPEEIDRVEASITKNELRKLMHDGVIRSKPKLGVSKDGHGKRTKGSGSRKGSKFPKKKLWIMKIRALRKRLRKLVSKRSITKPTYRKLFGMTKGGAFRNTGHLNEYIETNKLLRRK
ncbi:MAG: 50S ribosomal protein L19e [Candidatus Bathyarchaeota archaeon]|nr:50S ribosomal protein L19e [Candidatus Bathyarchaeota archaeon]MCZ2845157.1 50S ribosomal protein L19e [Candidatus Bathyarchaeota archaeon]